MKILLTLLFVLFMSTSSGYAYIEENNVGDTEATAGEQNTNLYRLNAKGALSVKKLKRIDEYVARNQARGHVVSASDLEDLLLSESEEKEKKELERMTAEISKQLANPKQLIQQTAADTYNMLQNISVSQTRDAEIAKSLKFRSAREY